MMPGMLTATGVSVAVDEQVLLPTTSATIAAGGALAIRGPNGAGKTTLLRVLAGLTPPSTGGVTWQGEPLRIRRAGHRAAVAAMIGMPPLARDLTLVEQLRFVRATWGDSAADGERAALEGLAELDISALAMRYPTELSSGQLQLFSLALTFARPCRVLLLDEPEQRLDAHRRGLVAEALRRRMASGVAIGLATHSGKLVRSIGAEVLTVGDAS
ncbi:ABC-2 type transport system ATP-binding protein [Microbacterium sp. ZKA21]